MQERKQVIGVLVTIMLIAWSILPLIQFWPILDDQEFDAALIWAETQAFPDTETTKKYPFTTLTRAEAAQRYVQFAHSREMLFVSTGCDFSDISDLWTGIQEAIRQSCLYGFFKGRGGEFRPYQYVSKAESLVALVRGIAKGVSFVEPELIYREPYVTWAYEHGITKRKSTPYMMYLVTRYELLLQLRRARGK